MANIRVRATGTLGGNLCFAEPHSDPATMLLVLGTTVRIALWLETPDGGRTFSAARVAVGCVCPFPSRAPAAEALMIGTRADIERRLPEAAALIADGADLVDDHEGSAEYKRHLMAVFLRRTFQKATGSMS